MYYEHTHWVCDFSELVSSKEKVGECKFGPGAAQPTLIKCLATQDCGAPERCGEKPCE